uniref:Uncharacterized protein n=1 Tax=Talaromyces marneffei PM1 TaxID=1077442 RepID=A0A093V8D5_TALMA
MSTRNNQALDAVGTQPFHPNRLAEDVPREKWLTEARSINSAAKPPKPIQPLNSTPKL